jgi:uncharacterized protein
MDGETPSPAHHAAPRVIDIHVHVFPDAVAAKAMPVMARNANVTPVFDGTVSGLLAAMDRGGVETSCIQPVATKPESVASMNDWAASTASARIAPFGAMHPALADPAAEMARMVALGLHGFKLHPEFQAFHPDDERLRPIYEAAIEHGMAVFFHAGLDLAIPTEHSDPSRFARVLDDFPDLTVILAHMGGWRQWDAVPAALCGRNVFLETSYTLPYVGPAAFVDLVRAHGADKVVFGSDGPWAEVGGDVRAVSSLGLDEDELQAILWRNAAELLARHH